MQIIKVLKVVKFREGMKMAIWHTDGHKIPSYACRHTDRHSDKQTDDEQTDTQTDSQTDSQTDTETNRHTNTHRQTDRQTDSQTDRHTCITISQKCQNGYHKCLTASVPILKYFTFVTDHNRCVLLFKSSSMSVHLRYVICLSPL